MVTVPRRQPRSKPYERKPKEVTSKTGPPVKTSAQPLTMSKRQNLTLDDWLTVFAHVDAHPNLSQAQVVEFFRTRVQGKLEFTQASLSRKLKARKELEERVHLNPTALSSKRPRIVTRPDVEEALPLWIRSMKTKGHVVNDPMLREKRRKFEEQMNVPEAERLAGEGWIAPFFRAYNIKAHRRHGEAGSVDQEIPVKQEQLRVAKLKLSTFPKQDRFNFDETSLFPMNRVFGELDELQPIEEEENFNTDAAVFEDDVAIITKVHCREALRNRDIIEVDSDGDDDNGDSGPGITTAELMGICQKLEDGYISRAGAGASLDFLHHIRAFRAKLRYEDMKNAEQITLDRYMKSS